MTTPGAVLVIAPIEPSNDAPFHVVADRHMQGGSHAVADMAARNALPAHLLTPGTTATLPDGTWFVWSGSTWATPPGSGDLVTSVAGRIGDVVLSSSDISGLGSAALAETSDFAPAVHTHAVADIVGVSSQVLVGRHAGGSGAAQQVTVDGGLEWQGSAIRRSALTGDVTASAGSASTTIAAGAVTDAKVATANKDGLAATPSMRTLGTGAQQAAAGDDSRLSDSRAPTAHASTHATGGSDELTPAAIGAEVAGAASTAVSAHVALADPHSQYQRESERAAANGYASLDAATKVPLAQIPTGTSSSTVALGDAPAAAVTTHAGLPDPHPQYALESALGGAAALNVGTGAGTVAAGNDARFTDARTPTAHAASHASGGGDPITPAAIGAEAAGAAAAAVSAHTGAADPHGDRAFATAAVAAITPASIGAEVAGTTATHAALTTAHGESAFGATLKTSSGAPAARSTLGLPASATRTITHSSSPPSGGVAGDIHFQIP